ncbi:thioredoxin domain-containing protein [Paenactinomyces guangxiensis]|uniref:thioredoxin domain-containing protein n=1 Tax=Paenactinomyces guangxiensis TaxID=1490290 RepID=UPI001E5C36E9|nr:thioredoxin domain-containing protein [Paenactinomyces guangxiensis]
MENGRNSNRLINEKSPYLLQHAYDPTDWFPWGEEAFEKAKQEDKPVFLSIGYSSCHWCHVMHRESFADSEVAGILNKDFISIKVDREERPDVDHIYMTVCQAMTGQGGWPLTIIMTPDKKPFFAGTYIPKEDRYGRTGLVKLLGRITELWKTERSKADDVSNRVIKAVRGYLNPVGEGELQAGVLDHAFEQFARQFDDVYGGFGDAPKFPRPHDLFFLLRYWKQTGEEEALHMVTHTLDAMRNGGIYDHLGYGFARYSVDREWLVPHFEKMLYDNALLAMAYLEAYQATKNEVYAEVAREIFTYVLRDMTSREGGFFSAEDADSEGVEGKFYVWTPEQIKEVLGEEEGELFCACYNVTPEGNFEDHTSILNQIHVSLEEIVKERKMTMDDLQKRLEESRKKLLSAREKRVHPGKDDKVLTSWNGLMIAAFAHGFRVLGETGYGEAAAEAVQFINEKLRREDGRLLARYRDGESAYLAYLDDYAFLAWGLMELYEATFRKEYLEQAIDMSKEMLELFGDPEGSGFYFYGKDGEELFARPKEIYDGATPSGNSVAAYNLIRLAKLTTDDLFIKEADKQLKAFAQSVASSPISHSFFLMAVQFALGPTKEIVIAGEPNDVQTKEMIRLVQRAYLPDAVIAMYPQGDDVNTMKYWIPDVDGKTGAREPKATVYLCENYACRAPITDVEELKKQLGS